MLKQAPTIEEVADRVTALEAQVVRLRQDFSERVVVLRSITREEAKAEIIGLFAGGETLYYSDISERLRIDLPVVLEICQELEEEGAIGVDADPV